MRACNHLDREVKQLIENELQNKALANSNGITSNYVQPASIAALRYQPVFPDGYSALHQLPIHHPFTPQVSPLSSNVPSPAFTTHPLHGPASPKCVKQSPSYGFGDTELAFGMPRDQAQRQNDFNHDIVRLFSACELSWYLLDWPEFCHFTAKWIPNVKLPDRRTASGPLLEAEVKRITESTKNCVSGKLANYQCDGWKNVAKVNVISSMIVVENEVRPIEALI